MLLDHCQVQFGGDLGGGHAAAHVLLVRVDQNRRSGQLFVVQQFPELLLGQVYSVAVGTVDDEYHELGVAVVSTPALP